MSYSQPLLPKPKTGSEKMAHIISDTFWTKYAFLLLIALSLAVDFLGPYLIRQRILPSSVRFIADMAIMGMFLLLLLRTVTFDKIPVSLLLILGITLIWGAVAFFEGQPPVATLWGWWRLFKFPIVAVLTYLQPFWPANFAEQLRRLCLHALQINLVLQLIQYAQGEAPGDHLSGFFGRHGVAPLLLFIFFCLSLAFGRWLAMNRWDMLMWVMATGLIASSLGEMKLFPFALVAVGLVAFVLQMIRGGQLQKLIMYACLVSLFTMAFGAVYNQVVAEANGSKRLEEYLDPDTLDEYLNRSYTRGGGKFYIGRGFALQLGWQNIQRDATTFLFGMGMGARGESQTLGVAGSGLLSSDYGLTSGTSLLVLMQELGVVGLAVFGLIGLWIVGILWQDISRDLESPENSLRYAVIIMTIMWPLWLWYSQTWTFSVFMTLYWGSVGYLLGVARLSRQEKLKIRQL